MRTNTIRGARALLCLAAMSALTICARAQSFYHLYGGSCIERGTGGVQPVSTGGYIAAGPSFSNNSNCDSSDVYVVKTNNAGAVVWANTYNIRGKDIAFDIRECANGDFIVTGVADREQPGQGDLFLLRLSSAGAVNWVKTYGVGTLEEAGLCVLETSNGDLVAAGYRYNGSVQEPYLIRTTSAGMQLWDRGYVPNNASLNANGGLFNSVDEARVDVNGNGSGVGDLIAAGTLTVRLNATSNNDLLLARVNGGNGGFTGATHGSMIWGGDLNEAARTVQEMRVGADAGNIILVGDYFRWTTIAPLVLIQTPVRGIVMKTGPYPQNGPTLARLYKSLNSQGETGSWVRETRSIGAGLRTGNLLVTGRSVFGNMTEQAYLTEFDPTTLALAPLPSVRFHLYAVQDSTEGYSVAEVPGSVGSRSPGLVMAGTAKLNGNWQLLMVKTDSIGLAPNCFPTQDELDNPEQTFPWQQVPFVLDSIRNPTPQSSSPQALTTNFEICYSSEDLTGGGWSKLNLGAAPLDEAGEGALLIVPNPVHPGATITLSPRRAIAGEMLITVSDMAGRVVYSARLSDVAARRAIPLTIGDWPAGTYLVKADGERESSVGTIVVSGAR